MISIKTHTLLTLLGLLTGFTLIAQSVSIEYGQDTVVAEGKYDRLYQVVSESKVDVNTLIKVDAVQWGQVHPSITVEQRIWKDFTVEPSFTFSSLDWSRAEGIKFAMKPEASIKYYFNRSRRERLGKNVVGFSADYFAVGFAYTFTDDKVFYNNELGESYITLENGESDLVDDHFSYYNWYVLYGIQRRFGKVAYVDVAGGMERNYFGDYGISKIIPTIRIKIGFSLSTEQVKRFVR